MKHTSRRQFFARFASVATAGPLLISRPATAIEPINRTRPSQLRLSIAAYSYRQFLQGPEKRMDLFDFCDLAADLGLDAVEPTSYYFPEDVDDDYLNRLKLHAFRLGLDISGTAIGNNFTLPPGPDRDEQLALTRTWIDHASTLGAPVIRIFAGNVPRGGSEEEAIERTIEAIGQSLEYAAARGVALALENHGGITTEAATLVRIVEAIDAPAGNFGINFDSGNFHSADPYTELELIAPYAINAQVKVDMHSPDGGKVPADLARVIEILKNSRYTGYVVLEYEGDDDPMHAIPDVIEELRDLIG